MAWAGRMTDNEELIKRLNDALAYEYQAVIMYTTYGATVDGIHRGELREFFQAEIADEQAHAQFLADKISALGGKPVADPAPVKIPDGARAMLENVLSAENEAIYRYTELREVADDHGDVGLVVDIEDIIRDETQHKEETEKILRGNWDE